MTPAARIWVTYLYTVMLEEAEFPALSQAVALIVWVPEATFLVFQEQV